MVCLSTPVFINLDLLICKIEILPFRHLSVSEDLSDKGGRGEDQVYLVQSEGNFAADFSAWSGLEQVALALQVYV